MYQKRKILMAVLWGIIIAIVLNSYTQENVIFTWQAWLLLLGSNICFGIIYSKNKE